MTPEEQQLRILAPVKGNWFHSFEAMPGLWTAGHKSREVMEFELEHWRFPADLTGKTVLDIGCADGGFSVAALQRGARSVLAVDEQVTTGMRHFNAVRPYPEIEFRQVGLFSDAFMALPKFDFIIFAGVLYHVHDMLEALKRVRSKAAGTVMLETVYNQTLGAWPPAAIFYEKDEFHNDPTNWWAPNFACLEAMLRVAGFDFERTLPAGPETGLTEGRAAYLLTPSSEGLFGSITESATGSHSMLEEAHQLIDRLRAENAELKARLKS
ncbi:class I SAM-dependent methyltransferase [Rhizorhabdus dicambivorans]|nr:class I SAM-dependent methyltransferase [Rhizorhabdus dicambivorans]